MHYLPLLRAAPSLAVITFTVRFVPLNICATKDFWFCGHSGKTWHMAAHHHPTTEQRELLLQLFAFAAPSTGGKGRRRLISCCRRRRTIKRSACIHTFLSSGGHKRCLCRWLVYFQRFAAITINRRCVALNGTDAFGYGGRAFIPPITPASPCPILPSWLPCTFNAQLLRCAPSAAKKIPPLSITFVAYGATARASILMNYRLCNAEQDNITLPCVSSPSVAACCVLGVARAHFVSHARGKDCFPPLSKPSVAISFIFIRACLRTRRDVSGLLST